MGNERGDDADQRRADVYSSARIGAAAALTLVLVVLLVLDVAVPDYDICPGDPPAPSRREPSRSWGSRPRLLATREVTTTTPRPDQQGLRLADNRGAKVGLWLRVRDVGRSGATLTL